MMQRLHGWGWRHLPLLDGREVRETMIRDGILDPDPPLPRLMHVAIGLPLDATAQRAVADEAGDGVDGGNGAFAARCDVEWHHWCAEAA